jgi:hypothetical protein
VTDAWWLGNEPVSTNHFLPGHLRVHLKHSHFSPMQLQYSTLTLTRELDRMNRKAVAHVLRVGRQGGALKFAAMILFGRAPPWYSSCMMLTNTSFTGKKPCLSNFSNWL